MLLVFLILLIAAPAWMCLTVIKREQFTLIFFMLVCLLVTVSNAVYADGLSRALLIESLRETLVIYAIACILPFMMASMYHGIHKKSAVWVLWPAYVTAIPLLFKTISHGEVMTLGEHTDLLLVFGVACVCLVGLFYVDFSRIKKIAYKQKMESSQEAADG